jgi:hypothetical protein
MLEVLAAVQPERTPRFAELEGLVLGHTVVLSGCLLVLLDWDEPRRALVRRLKALGIPTLAMVVVAPGRAAGFDRGPADDQPEHLVVLEAGQVGDTLQRLEGLS